MTYVANMVWRVDILPIPTRRHKHLGSQKCARFAGKMFRFIRGPVLFYTHMGHGLLRLIGFIVRSNAVSIVRLNWLFIDSQFSPKKRITRQNA